MRACVVFIGPRRRAKSCSASDREVLASLLVFLWIQVGFDHDVDPTLTSPVPVNDLLRKCGHVGVVELVLGRRLLQFGPFFWAWMERWIVVRFFWWWQCVVSNVPGVPVVCHHPPATSGRGK